MKKFQLNKQKLNLKNLTTPLLALSLMAGCAGLFGGSASAASVTVSESVNSSWPAYYTNSPECDSLFPGAAICDETAVYFPSISSAWPLNHDSLSSGGNFWHFGPEDSKYLNNQNLLNSEIPGGRRFEHLRFSSSLECKNSKSITSATYKVKIRINSNGTGSYDNNGVIYIALWNLKDGNDPIVINSRELSASNISSDFMEYTFQAPAGSLPISLGELNKRYELAVMYESAGAVSGKTLSIDLDEASRELVYDDTSANCLPTISPSSTTIPSSTASGSTVVAGSILKATDPDGDKLSYSITLGNDSNYFAIDPITGDITTTKTNIPAGTYTITVQVDDGKGGTATAIATIAVKAENSAVPVVNNTTNRPAPVEPAKPSRPSNPTLANTGQSLKAITIVATIALGLAGYVRLKNKNSNSYVRR